MRAEVTSRRTLPDVPSASALEICGHVLLVVGDDSRFVFVLDQEGRELGRISLFSPSRPESLRIPKKEKPDLEASFLVRDRDGASLFIFGSGSRGPRRDVCYSVRILENCLTSTDPQHWEQATRVDRKELTALYDSIRADPRLNSGAEGGLNIEAAAVADGNLLLFQRGVKGRLNAVISMRMSDFSDWFSNKRNFLPPYSIAVYGLPSLDGVGTGFSGAAVEPGVNSIIFCASAEDTADPVLDGEVRGSIIGKLPRGTGADAPHGDALEWAELTCNGQRYIGKVESLAFKAQLGNGGALLHAVTDDDRGGSELLEIATSE